MAQAVSEWADLAVVTSDNPRSEAPEAIIDDIVPGFSTENARNGFQWKRNADRREAIAMAIAEATPEDLILVAGKGHEDYQEINGVRHPFHDTEVCLGILERNGIL